MGKISPKQSDSTHLESLWWCFRPILPMGSFYKLFYFQKNVLGTRRFFRNKRVIRVNPWVELVQRTTKVILNISHGFILQTLSFPKECPWNSLNMCSMTLVLLWTNSIHGFTLISLFVSKETSLGLSGDV